MTKSKKIEASRNLLIVVGAVVLIVGLVVFNLLSNYFFFLSRAHSSFENYFAFRGCKQLLDRTDTYGICRTATSETIKIVLYKGKWYLDDDLPGCYFGVCF